MYSKTCNYCGTFLEVGEACQCRTKKGKAAPVMSEAASQKDYSKPNTKLPLPTLNVNIGGHAHAKT